MRVLPFPVRAVVSLGLAALCATTAKAAEPSVLNLYSARHYQTDEALYSNFTKQTGIRIQRVDADDAGILARLKSEGTSSPADVVLLVDAARLWRAEVDGLFQAVRSPALESKIPAQLRGKDDGQGSQWFGFSTRARMVIYNKQMVSKADVDTYEKLANPALKGKLCTRSGSHPYNLSLFGSMTERLGAAATENWLKGLVSNMARTPKGGDTDQIKATATGECGVAVVNSYYLARMLRSSKPEDRDAVEKIGYVMPDQAAAGTHMNIAGGAVARHSKNREAAVKFLEYLASDAAQAYFADGNNEWPVVKSVKISNPALDSFGTFKMETTPISVIGMNQVKVQQMLDRVGYK
ncbi:MAG: Fe(3+) ABC transporter substrate-binding protein [Ideonella sp. MAG2]|nr:MAG: Fe(3+) ABC transporter substrate-binding protein [Ideonella sp. MAG2]